MKLHGRLGFSLSLLVVFISGCGASPPMIPLVSDVYSLTAGEEKYYCYAKTVSKETAIDQVVVHNGALVHHLAVFQVMKGSQEPEGFSECPAQIKQTWLPLYGGGRNTPGMKTPPGVAFKFPEQTQILMQLHLVNATPGVVSERTSVELVEVPDSAALIPAGIFAVGNQTFKLPPGARDMPVSGECDSPKPLDVFALFPHMHARGTRISIDHGADKASATTVYAVDPWSFGDQPMQMQTMRVEKGDYLKATCLFNNDDPNEVKYGESTQDEMCFMVLFYTPFDRLDGCID